MDHEGSRMMHEALEKSHSGRQIRILIRALDLVPESVMITDRYGKIEFVNPVFERTSGYTFEEVREKTPRILKSGKHDAAFYQGLWETILTGRVWTGRIVNRRKDGELFEEEVKIAPTRGRLGQATNYVAVKRDVTQEVQNKARLQQAQKMEAVGRLAGGIAHDFRNILQILMGHLDLLVAALPPETRRREDLEIIRSTIQQGTNLTRQLLAFSRQQQLKLTVLDLNHSVEIFLKMLQGFLGKSVQMEFKPDPRLCLMQADPAQLHQVLLNLCINAKNAMPEGGRITIQTENIHVNRQNREDFPWTVEGDYVLLTVSDTGVGMPPEVQKHIFEPFFTTKNETEGSGLGLSTAYGIIKQHGGYIYVTSEPGKGTTFKICLPCFRDDQAITVESRAGALERGRER